MKMRFLIDENLSLDFVSAIKQLDATIDVIAVGTDGAPPKGTLDPDILLFCEAEQRALVTNNRASMPGHEHDHFATGKHHWGVFTLKDGFGIGAYAAAIHLLWAASEAEEWADLSDWIPW